MKKDEIVMAAASFLVAMLLAMVNMMLDNALAEAIATGDSALLSRVENGQIIFAILEFLIIIGIAMMIKFDLAARSHKGRAG